MTYIQALQESATTTQLEALENAGYTVESLIYEVSPELSDKHVDDFVDLDELNSMLQGLMTCVQVW